MTVVDLTTADVLTTVDDPSEASVRLRPMTESDARTTVIIQRRTVILAKIGEMTTLGTRSLLNARTPIVHRGEIRFTRLSASLRTLWDLVASIE